MKFFLVILLSIISGWAGVPLFAAEAPSTAKTKPAAQAKGYVSFGNHNDLVEKAKQERNLRILVNMDAATLKVAAKAFNQRYPFINLHAQEITGTDMAQRNVLEIKSGRAREWDIIYPSRDLYSEYLPYLWKIDLLHMAERGVVQIPTAMIDPKNRNIVAPYTRIIASAYNKDSLSAEQLPKSWEDFLKPEFKGRKFAVDIGPRPIACLVPAWGLEKTMDFARKLAAQEPIWVRGVSRTLPSIVTGEIPMMMGTLLHSVKRAELKDRTGGPATSRPGAGAGLPDFRTGDSGHVPEPARGDPLAGVDGQFRVAEDCRRSGTHGIVAPVPRRGRRAGTAREKALMGELGTACKHGIVDDQTVRGLWLSQRSALSRSKYYLPKIS
jgi:hypothetical protein